MTQSHTKLHQFCSLTIGLVCVGLMVSGCTGPKGIFPNYLDDDIRERHLVVQQAKTQSLTLVPIGPKQDKINPNDIERITAFVDGYKQTGQDHLKIIYAGSQAAQPTLTALLEQLGETNMVTSSQKPRLGMVQIQLSYTASDIGLDPDCQGRHTNGGMTFMVPNKSIGCAFNLAVAKQINDPRELSEPRALEKKFIKTDNASNTSAKASGESQGSESRGRLTDTINSILK